MLALVPRQSGRAKRGKFGLVYQVAGADSAVDSYHDELAQLDGFDDTGPDYIGHSGYALSFDGAYTPDESAWSYFPPTNVLAARSQGMSSCWNPICGRVHTGSYWYALCSIYHTFETSSCRCKA